MGLQLLDYQPNLFFYRFYFVKNLVVPKSKNLKTSSIEYLCPILVIPLLLSVLPAIYFNYQFIFQADKIEDVISKWMLAAKFQTTNLTASQNVPQRSFGLRHSVT